MDYRPLPIRKRPLNYSLIQPAVFPLPICKRPRDCSLTQPAVKKRSTSGVPENGPRKRVTFSDQISTKLLVYHDDGTEGTFSRLDLVNGCRSEDVVPSPFSRTNSMDNREKSPLLPFLEGSPSNNSRGVQFQAKFNHDSPKSGEGNKQTEVLTYLFQKNAPAIERAWSGIIEVDGMMRLSVKMTAHLSAKVSLKAYKFSKKINPQLHSKLLPRRECYPRIFQDSRPNRDDIALYFYRPKDERPIGSYSQLLRGMAENDLMMHSHIDGIELLMFSSTILTADSQTMDNNYFIWGVFRRRADEV